MNRPVVSVVLPTFSRLHYLRPAVESVRSQTFQDWELIIADDGSDEATRNYLASLANDARITVLWLTHSGSPNITRNAALASATAHYVAFIDSDDLWLPRKLEEQIAILAETRCRWSYTGVSRIDAGGSIMTGDDCRSWTAYSGAIFKKLLTFEAAVATPAVIAERSLIAEAGGFDAGQIMYGDYDLWMRLALRANVAAIDRRLAMVRSHDEHYTSSGFRKINARRRLLEKMRSLTADRESLRIIDEQRASNAVDAARAFAAAGAVKSTLTALFSAAPYSWRAPRWWSGGLVAVGRSVLPNFGERALRRNQLRTMLESEARKA
jgi:glycosyltransferase involved in cell wall biosynthesis